MDDSVLAILPRALFAAASLRLADRMQEGVSSVDDLARVTGASEGSLYRLLRALSSVGVFEEVHPREFALTESGCRLASSNPVSLQAVLANADSSRAWEHVLDVIRTGRPAFAAEFGRTFFDDKVERTASMSAFANRMRQRSRELYRDFASNVPVEPQMVVVDVGGGTGWCAEQLMRETGCSAVIFDLPDVIALAREEFPTDLGSTPRFVGGDFFTSVPRGGDIYLLASVLHDWADDDARRILTACRNAMPDRGQLVVLEMIVPDGPEFHESKWSDLGMMVLLGGRERTGEEFGHLLASANFDLCSTTALPGSPVSVITAVPV